MFIYLQTLSEQSSWMPPGQILGAKLRVCSHSRWGTAYRATGKGTRQSFPGMSGTAAARVHVQKHTPHIRTDTHTLTKTSQHGHTVMCMLLTYAGL